MPFLSEADQDQLKTIFAEQLDRPVRLRVLTRPPSKLYIPGQQLCASCGEAEPFARELATLSDKLEVIVHDVQAEPAIAEQFDVDGLLPVILIERGDARRWRGDTGFRRRAFLGITSEIRVFYPRSGSH
jgi:hypothetical protein